VIPQLGSDLGDFAKKTVTAREPMKYATTWFIEACTTYQTSLNSRTKTKITMVVGYT